ncbi:MAG TPA: hypothetical protein IGR64_16525, partial [Leptolyngbyaceae cyanobacterium M65_K2018_010]|nr:hypothetical protein [Leptolyngbyaceae cyanobacterium M65_K2018_010]
MLDTFATGIVDIEFRNGHSAQVLSLSTEQTSTQALEVMGLMTSRPALVIIGGASLMTAESLEQLQTVFTQVLAPVAQEFEVTVLDGGTDAGVIHMMGQARSQVGGNFPLVGVVPQGKAKLPQDRATPQDDSRHALEPNHTNFFLIPGHDWGSESPWLADFASKISAQQPALTILINGGTVALTDLQANLATGRPALVMAGSGRLADQIAAAMAGETTDVPRAIAELIQTYQPTGKLDLLDLAMPTTE